MFQIQSFLYELLAKWTLALGDKYDEVKPRAEEIAADTLKSASALAKKVLDGEIKVEDVPVHLKQEFLVLKTELLEGAILGVSLGEETYNDFVDKFNAALSALGLKKD